MIKGIHDFKNVFLIGVAGVGMSAIAQYLAGIKKNVSGSDRYFVAGEFNDTKEKLEAAGIKCFLQNGDGITNETELVVVSTAIEDTVSTAYAHVLRQAERKTDTWTEALLVSHP